MYTEFISISYYNYSYFYDNLIKASFVYSNILNSSIPNLDDLHFILLLNEKDYLR